MFPFVLEYKAYKPKERVKNILHTKKVYGPHCKQPGWNAHGLSLPFDNDPFSPNYSLHTSHYARLGTDCDQWIATTAEALEEANSRRHELDIINPHKPIVNLHSFLGEKNLYECSPTQRQICSSLYGQDYISTMQYSYEPPYPYIAQRLSMPETPYLLNRRPKPLNPGRFLDDEYVADTQKLVKCKASHHISYNPGRGCYTYAGHEVSEGCNKH